MMRLGVLPSSENTSFSREGTTEAVREGGDGLRSPLLDAPETNQSTNRKLPHEQTIMTNCVCVIYSDSHHAFLLDRVIYYHLC